MRRRGLNEKIASFAHAPDAMRPVIKAYALGYMTSTIPRLPATINSILRSDLTLQQKLELIKTTLRSSFGINRFPTSCAIIVAGYSLIPRLLAKSLAWLCRIMPFNSLKRLLGVLHENTLFLSTFGSAWIAFQLLNKDQGWTRRRAQSDAAQVRPTFESPNQHHLPPPGYHMTYAGKTIDFTLFAFCRAVDVLLITTWIKHRGRALHPERIAPRTSAVAKRLADPWVFSISSAIIMWSWFFAQSRLPKSYNQWISKVADIDPRLVRALRLCRQGDLVYGEKGTQDANLPALCREINLPEEWGNPAYTVPIPCELYHCGAGKSCEVHAGQRFLRTFRFAMRLYLPLQLISLLRRFSLDSYRLVNLLKDAARSSSFLAAFVGLFYYGVCLARTRVGPAVFSRSTVTPQMWDSGLCVLAGCLICGWSILVEKASKRQEIAFFVAPRALATLLPRVYDKQYQLREQAVFATSVAIVMSAMRNRDHHVRGVFGTVLETVLR